MLVGSFVSKAQNKVGKTTTISNMPNSIITDFTMVCLLFNFQLHGNQGGEDNKNS